MTPGTLVRLSVKNDCYDHCLAKVISWDTESAEVEFVDWPVVYGPIHKTYEAPFPGALISVDSNDLTVISPLELLAMEA